jgi:hypothetical protein
MDAPNVESRVLRRGALGLHEELSDEIAPLIEPSSTVDLEAGSRRHAIAGASFRGCACR